MVVVVVVMTLAVEEAEALLLGTAVAEEEEALFLVTAMTIATEHLAEGKCLFST